MLTEFEMIEVTDSWLEENHWTLLQRAALLGEMLDAAKARDLLLYYITGRYKDRRFWQSCYVDPRFATDTEIDLEEFQREEALLWAAENYDQT